MLLLGLPNKMTWKSLLLRVSSSQISVLPWKKCRVSFGTKKGNIAMVTRK